MKRILALLGVIAMLGALVAFIPASSAEPPPDCDKVETGAQDDCKPDRPCKGQFGDKETARLVWQNYGEDITAACCIEWTVVGVAAWALPYQCDPPVCYDVFGDRAEELAKTYGNLIDTSVCCIDVDPLANVPAQDQRFICVPVPPVTVPTTVPEPEPDPTPEVIVVEVEVPAEPQIVTRTVAAPAIAFTG